MRVAQQHADCWIPMAQPFVGGPAHTWEVPPQELFRSLARDEEVTLMSEESADMRPLTSVELLDAAVWREIGSEKAQPASAFLEALSRLVGRWLLVRSDAPEMDAVTVLCKARGYIAQQDASRLKGTEWSW